MTSTNDAASFLRMHAAGFDNQIVRRQEELAFHRKRAAEIGAEIATVHAEAEGFRAAADRLEPPNADVREGEGRVESQGSGGMHRLWPFQQN